ncbi:hypothetical protein ACVWZ8_004377 [Arthrobacter sp. UYCu723]
MDDLLNTEDAAQYLTDLGIPTVRRTMENWRYKNCGPTYFRVGRRTVYAPKELNQWAELQIARVTP